MPLTHRQLSTRSTLRNRASRSGPGLELGVELGLELGLEQGLELGLELGPRQWFRERVRRRLGLGLRQRAPIVSPGAPSSQLCTYRAPRLVL